VSATLSNDDRHVIATKLHQINPVLITGSFERSNLSHVLLRHTNTRKDLYNLFQNYLLGDDKKLKGTVLVYEHRLSELVDMHQNISDMGKLHDFSVVSFFAELSDQGKDAVLEGSRGTPLVVVCTSAFGLGVNLPNVHSVVHFHAVKSMDEFVQEEGRAGRSGQNSYCIAYYSTKRKNLKNTAHTKPKKRLSVNEAAMSTYMARESCLTRVIRHFQGEVGDVPLRCNHCSVCVPALVLTADSSSQSLIRRLPRGSPCPDFVQTKVLQKRQELAAAWKLPLDDVIHEIILAEIFKNVSLWRSMILVDVVVHFEPIFDSYMLE
jgi:superfamily II DNA helicase RecQ